MTRNLGVSKKGIELAQTVKRAYRENEPICLPGGARFLMPEHLLNRQVSLDAFEDPLPLALVATRDPEGPMAVAATARISPLGAKQPLVKGIFELVGDTTRHEEVKKCVSLIRANDFNPTLIQKLHQHADSYVTRARRRYAEALKANLKSLMDGSLAPRIFVREFFELTETGNLRHEIRRKLVSSLLLSPNVRPSIKFLFLENFLRLPKTIRFAILTDVTSAPNTPHIQALKEELRWMFGDGASAATYN
ncbi:MAG: hypothetical protein ACPGO3_12615 [Magnetospiraceae bacterium]